LIKDPKKMKISWDKQIWVMAGFVSVFLIMIILSAPSIIKYYQNSPIRNSVTQAQYLKYINEQKIGEDPEISACVKAKQNQLMNLEPGVPLGLQIRLKPEIKPEVFESQIKKAYNLDIKKAPALDLYSGFAEAEQIYWLCALKLKHRDAVESANIIFNYVY
jgi:hypothetical protein